MYSFKPKSVLIWGIQKNLKTAKGRVIRWPRQWTTALALKLGFFTRLWTWSEENQTGKADPQGLHQLPIQSLQSQAPMKHSLLHVKECEDSGKIPQGTAELSEDFTEEGTLGRTSGPTGQARHWWTMLYSVAPDLWRAQSGPKSPILKTPRRTLSRPLPTPRDSRRLVSSEKGKQPGFSVNGERGSPLPS